MRVRAFAKINLGLRVLARRADGFHELRTIFQSIALHDTLTIRRTRAPFRLTCDDPDCPSDDTNLIWRAAEQIWKASGRRGTPRGVAVDVQKRIPLAAGLGGGSSDGAAALRALATLWRVPRMSEARLRAIGAELGADVPYFLEGGTVLGLERGDLLFPLVDHPPAWVVLVLPDFGVSTKEAFGWFDRYKDFTTEADSVNDLQAPVAAHHPSISRAVAALRKAGAWQAAMSGSGSAVFGLFRTRAAAARAARTHAAASRSRILLTRTLNRSTYQRLAAP